MLEFYVINAITSHAREAERITTQAVHEQTCGQGARHLGVASKDCAIPFTYLWCDVACHRRPMRSLTTHAALTRQDVVS